MLVISTESVSLPFGSNSMAKSFLSTGVIPKKLVPSNSTAPKIPSSKIKSKYELSSARTEESTVGGK